MLIAELLIFVISETRALTIHFFQLVKKVCERRFSIGSLINAPYENNQQQAVVVECVTHPSCNMHIHMLSSSLSWRVSRKTQQRSFLVTAWGYNPTFRHLLWQKVQRKILAAMCGIKCIKNLLFAFNFIFWVCIINSELVFVLLRCTVQLKFVGNLSFSALQRFILKLSQNLFRFLDFY